MDIVTIVLAYIALMAFLTAAAWLLRSSADAIRCEECPRCSCECSSPCTQDCDCYTEVDA